MMEGRLMPLGAEEIAAAKAAVAIVQIAQKQGWLDNLGNLFRRRHYILVLGSTGVGKSNFLASLKTLVPVAIDRMRRTTDVVPTSNIRLGSDLFRFIDTPGQEFHKPRRMKGI